MFYNQASNSVEGVVHRIEYFVIVWNIFVISARIYNHSSEPPRQGGSNVNRLNKAVQMRAVSYVREKKYPLANAMSFKMCFI